MSSHKALTGVYNYVEFKEETIVERVKKMVNLRDEVDVENAHVKFSYGNRKTGNLVPSVSMIPIHDCGSNCGACAKGCYAVRNICCYDATRRMLANNSAIYAADPERYFSEIEYEVKYRSFFRYHVSGDIKDRYYLSQMARIARAVPTCKFLAFTKMFGLVNEWIHENGDLPSNLHIIFSEWRGLDVPNPHNLPTSRPVWPGEKVDGIWCGGNCTKCAKAGCGCWSLKPGDRILFEAH